MKIKFFLLCLVFTFVLPISAKALVLENFDSYSDSALHGQGGWSGDTNPLVQSSVSQSASKAVRYNGGGGLDALKKDITDITTDTSTASCYVRTTDANNGGGGSFGCGFWEGSTDLYTIQLSQDNNNIRLWGSSFTTIGTPSANTWYKLEIEFDFTNDRARARVDGGSWSSYVAAKGSAAFSSITHIGVQYGGTVGSSYIDTYEATYVEEEEPVLGCTDPEASNYDPLATEDDDSCEYLPDAGSINPFNFNDNLLFVTASSTCSQVGTTSPVVFNCVGTSTEPVITYQDWLFVMGILIFLNMFIPIGFVTSVMIKKK